MDEDTTKISLKRQQTLKPVPRNEVRQSHKKQGDPGPEVNPPFCHCCNCRGTILEHGASGELALFAHVPVSNEKEITELVDARPKQESKTGCPETEEVNQAIERTRAKVQER